MAIMLLFITAAAPSIRQQTQRMREAEAIARGEEVAEAIRLYVARARRLPTSIEELLEGVPFGTKKLQVLRPSAAHDPLSADGNGEWKLIRKTDAAFVSFQRAVALYAGGISPETSDQTFVQVAGQLPRVAALIDTGSKDEGTSSEDDSVNSTGPFVGVASRSHRSSIITYYGIERHDEWVFTPYFR
jgi:type II secretory pathway pseudopilin PulG